MVKSIRESVATVLFDQVCKTSAFLTTYKLEAENNAQKIKEIKNNLI